MTQTETDSPPDEEQREEQRQEQRQQDEQARHAHEVDADAQAPTASTPCQVRGRVGLDGGGVGIMLSFDSTIAAAFATCRGIRACPVCLRVCVYGIVDMIIGMRQ